MIFDNQAGRSLRLMDTQSHSFSQLELLPGAIDLLATLGFTWTGLSGFELLRTPDFELMDYVRNNLYSGVSRETSASLL